MNPIVGIIMGSDSDLNIMSEAAKVLEKLGVPYEMTIISAHRTPERILEYASTAQERGLKTIIAGAGGAAHLAGVTAALTLLPVIGVPIQSKALSGVDSLYSTVQMPPGIPVATVAINGAQNAGILAAQIIASYDADVAKKVADFKADLKKSVNAKADKLEKLGYEAYLEQM
ncbi:MAG: 5-(carboxyamino)imidazole ribonucleotide mutase [Firmicutes bacterium]|nr:5-(carboxyamino)imidazole ribonucleotide mutase [Bacillota bacterium]MBR0104437.1 5-(carboxyamino)imidazole ribonucleotide mutase [Bacillota bacterium]